MASGAPIYEAFGLRVASRLMVEGLPTTTAGGPPDVELVLASAAEVAAAFSGPASPPRAREVRLGDGCTYRVERGAAGDHVLTYGDRATFHLTAEADVVRCAPAAIDAPAWQRFLLDTVLGTAALVHGFEALHAAAALGDAGVIAIAAASGGGKSTLLAQLLRRGHHLFCDDILALARVGDAVVGWPGPPLMNLAAELAGGARADQIGRVIAALDGECWTLVARPRLEPAPIGLVALLHRGAEGPARVEPLAADGTTLLAHSLNSGGEGDRLARRFSLFADLAMQTRVVRLHAPYSTGPEELADLMISAAP